MNYINNKSPLKLIRNSSKPNLYNLSFIIRTPLLISFVKHFRC